VVVNGAVEDVGESMRRRGNWLGHERTGRGHERNHCWLDENGSSLRLVRTKYEEQRGGEFDDGCVDATA
jgi:hypothetical protein